MGRAKESEPEIERARQLDPNSARIKQTAGRVYYLQRRYDDAIESLEDAARTDPTLASTHELSALVLEQKNQRLEAVERYLRARVLSATQPDYPALLKTAYIKNGWEGFWRQELTYLKDRARSQYVPATRFADVFLRLGDTREALGWLGRGIDEHDERVVALKVDPSYDALRSDPKFEELARRVSQ